MAVGLTIIILVAVALLAVVIIAWAIGLYNAFVRLRNDINKAIGNIDVLLKQRHDELPKLINTVKGYMKHERGTLIELVKLRNAWVTTQTLPQKARISNQISAALKTIFAVAENYPQLRASENFKQLQERISGLENEIADRREFYNDAVNTFNIKIESFPDKIIAGFMKLTQPREMFKATEEERKDVEVKF